MKERIKNKIDEYITSILNKETIDKEDYATLTHELSRIKALEDDQKWEDEKEERIKALVCTMMR